VEEGEYVLLEGRSGAGKTTLLNIAGLLDPPTRGRVRFQGSDVTRARDHERAALRLSGIGFVFQHHYLVPDLTIRENVALPALAIGTPDAWSRADSLVDRMGLAPATARFPRELSGGEQQRAGVARALVNQPALLLADEPTGNLDAASADVVAQMLGDAHHEGAAVLLATHDAARFPQAERRLRLEGGRLMPP
jgi:ABC-type lipoprotein export system ATPase subunit